MKFGGWIIARGWLSAALLCTGCIVEDADPEADGAVDMRVQADRGLDARPPDATPPRDATPVPDAARPPDRGLPPDPPDRGLPPDQGPDVGPGPGVVYHTLLLFDDGSMDDGTGTTGADFCGVSTECAEPVSATVVLGAGTVCDAEGPGCVTDRSDALAILDDGARCAVDSVPSDFVSVGSDGQIAVTFDGDLRGCQITVVEFQGMFIEPWSAYICDTADVGVALCLNDDLPVVSAPDGGSVTFIAPAE